MRYYIQKFIGVYEKELDILSQIVPKAGIAIDVGGNKGIYAYALSKIANEVVCFEPLKECAEYILEYGSSKIIVKQLALSDEVGEFTLYVPIIERRVISTRASLIKPDGDSEARKIQISKLDSFHFPKVDFIKIDTEGSEASVLRGAAGILKKFKPSLLVEIDINRHSEKSFLEVFSYIKEFGYLAYILNSGRLIESVDHLKDGQSKYNFIFLPDNAI
ncbi:FkbM family methyltransferase [Leptospira dzoumogneensis]|nr:FkbM family methyltransferase [Leptospira dzoumogneensis]